MKIYVGNLSENVEDSDLKELFSETGDIKSSIIIKDKGTGVSKGFGFIEFGTQKEGQTAISKFNGHEFYGNKLKVNESKSKSKRQSKNSMRW